jgi:sec-independent protein translocase protein TatA
MRRRGVGGLCNPPAPGRAAASGTETGPVGPADPPGCGNRQDEIGRHTQTHPSGVVIAMFGIGPMEMFIVAIVALLLFGNRLPSVMRSLGTGISEFKRGLNEVTREVTKEVDDR